MPSATKPRKAREKVCTSNPAKCVGAHPAQWGEPTTRPTYRAWTQAPKGGPGEEYESKNLYEVTLKALEWFIMRPLQEVWIEVPTVEVDVNVKCPAGTEYVADVYMSSGHTLRFKMGKSGKFWHATMKTPQDPDVDGVLKDYVADLKEVAASAAMQSVVKVA